MVGALSICGMRNRRSRTFIAVRNGFPKERPAMDAIAAMETSVAASAVCASRVGWMIK